MLFPILILSSNRFSILTLRQASFDRLRTEQDRQGEQIGKVFSSKFVRTAWKPMPL
jgi:hypothetical protein